MAAVVVKIPKCSRLHTVQGLDAEMLSGMQRAPGWEYFRSVVRVSVQL